MRMWEIRESAEPIYKKHRYSKEYECGYEDGYEAAKKELEEDDEMGYRHSLRDKKYR